MSVSRKRKQHSPAHTSSSQQPDRTSKMLQVDTSILCQNLDTFGLPAVLVQEIISYLVPALLHDADIIKYEELGAMLLSACISFQTRKTHSCVVIRNLDLSLTAILSFRRMRGASNPHMLWVHAVYGDVNLLQSEAWLHIFGDFPCVGCDQTGMQYILPSEPEERPDKSTMYTQEVPEKTFMESLICPVWGENVELFVLPYPMEDAIVDVLCRFKIKRS